MATKRSLQTRTARQSPNRSLRRTSVLMLLTSAAVVAALIIIFNPLEWAKGPNISITAEHAAFSPNGDGTLDNAAVVYGLSQDANVTIEVLDASGLAIRTLLSDEPLVAGQHSVVWDGQTEGGSFVTDGEYTIQVKAQGATRSSSNAFRLEADTTPPIIRLANLPEGHKVGEEDLLIEGTTEPGATVWLDDAPQPITADGNGGFSAQVQLREGVNRIELRAVDAAGNTASVARNVSLILEPPEIIVDNPPDGLWINQRLLSVQGRLTEPDANLEINGQPAAVDDDGRFNVDVLLEQGENVVRLEAVDSVGNQSVVEHRVFLKTAPPPITIRSIQEGDTVHQPAILVAGETEPQAQVRVNGQEVTVDTQGGFQHVVNLVEGVNLIRVEVIDRAGNSAATTRSLTYTVGEPQNNQNTLRTAALAGGAGVLIALAFWLALGSWYGPNGLTFVSPYPFLSTDPLEHHDVPLRLTLDRAARVKVQVWNEEDELVTTLIDRRRWHAGEHELAWDGTDRLGQLVPEGAYEIEATASTIFTNVSNRLQVFKTSQPLPQLSQLRIPASGREELRVGGSE